MSNLTMDLTGSLSNYAESNKIYRIFKYGQIVDFDTTVFVDSIHVYIISGGVSNQELVYDTDYTVTDELVATCDNDMSGAKLIDPNFSKTLCSGIKMLKGVTIGTTYTIAVSYQRLYPNQIKTAYFHNEPLNVTPELMLDVIKNIEQLKILNNDVTDIFSLDSTESILFELDESCSNDNNIVTDEVHVIDVPNKKYVIYPKGGSFYYDSVVVKHPDSNTTLVLGEDYKIVGMSEAKTKASSYKAPVYNFIVIQAAITGTVTVSYHAYGGDVTVDNYREMLKQTYNVINYLNGAKTVTEDTLGTTEIMSSLFRRIETLESNMRRLQGVPSYGDVSNGKCTRMKIYSAKSGLHWYTIASLYTVDGSGTSPCTADTFTFRLQTDLSHIQFTAAVSVDLNNNENDRVNINVVSENYPRGYVPFVDYGKVDLAIQPQLRVVWDEDGDATGAYLQLGFELKNMVEETLAIEDISGNESCWKLVDEVKTVTTPQDSEFLLPNGTSTWSDLLDASKQESMLVPFRKGHIAWAGTKALNRPVEGWQYFEISDNLLIDQSCNIRKFTGIKLDIEEVNGFQFPVIIRFNQGSEVLKGHASFTHQDRPAYVNAEVYRDKDDKIVVRLNYDITAGITSNELDLRDVVILLD